MIALIMGLLALFAGALWVLSSNRLHNEKYQTFNVDPPWWANPEHFRAATICLGAFAVQQLLLDLHPAAAGISLAVAGVLSTDDFQASVLGGVEEITTEFQKVKADVLQNSRAVRGAMEDLTKLKKSANDQQANSDRFVRSLQRLEALLSFETRHAGGCPLQRFMANGPKWDRFNAYIRRSMGAPLGGRHKDALKFLADDKDATLACREIAQRALGEDSSPGSTIIDDRLFPEVYDTLSTFGVWPTFDVKRLVTKDTKFPIRTSRVKAQYILTEGDPIPDDANKAGTSVTLTVELVAALLLVSEQLRQDAEIDLDADSINEFVEAFGERLDASCLTADGTADGDNGGMTGILSGGTAAVAADGNTTVENLDFDDVLRVLLTVDPIVLSRKARWWVHPQILARMLSIKDGNGRPIFLTAIEAPAPGSLGSILGYPVTLAHAAPSTNAPSKKVAGFGDPNGLAVGIRTDWQFEQSRDFKFNTYQRALRGVGRVGTKIRRANAFGVLTTAAA